MLSSKFATTTDNGDAMDIDTPPSASHRPPLPPQGPSRPHPRPNIITRHVFYVPIMIRGMSTPPTDLKVLYHALDVIHSDLAAGDIRNIPNSLAPGARQNHLMILIGLAHSDRMRALGTISRRLGTMIQMCEDELGWLNNLPYSHPNFEVQFLRGFVRGRRGGR